MNFTGSDTRNGSNLKITIMNNMYYTQHNNLYYPIGAQIALNKPSIKEFFNAFIEKVELTPETVINFICRGSSGAILASHFAMNIDNEAHIVYVRKDGEMKECHSSSSEDFSPLSYAKAHNVIIDDFVSSGNTINAIYRKIIQYYPGLKINGVVVAGGNVDGYINFKPEYTLTSQSPVQ